MPVTRWLRLEGLASFAVAIVMYSQAADSWLLFIALLLVPDLSMIGYVGGPRSGAVLYNLAHTYSIALALAAFGVVSGQALAVSIALIWVAHIGMDRMLGYGLKLSSGFQDTHLGRIGRDTATALA